MKNFHQLLLEAPGIKDILDEHQDYWAHIHKDKKEELLSEHIDLVNLYADQLVQIHELNPVIDQLIDELVNGYGNKKKCLEKLKKLIKTLFVHAIVFHDFGKINENFQLKKMKNEAFSECPNKSLHPIYGHSYLGAFIYLNYHINKIIEPDSIFHCQDQRSLMISYCFIFSYSILQHHSPVLFGVTANEYGVFFRFKEVIDDLKPYLLKYHIGKPENELILKNIFNNFDRIWYEKVVGNLNKNVSFPLFALIKLNFSLLTASDYLATHEYMNSDISNPNSAKIEDFGIFNKERINEIYKHLTEYKFNREIYIDLESHQINFPEEISNKNLNFLRKQMGIEVARTIQKHYKESLFYLEAPTGGGKTNLSALAIVELLKLNSDLNKIFYVSPFTALISQTYASLKGSMGLNNSEIVELHSKAMLSSKNGEKNIESKEEAKEKLEDGFYGDEKKDFIDRLFVLYPLTLLSHVKFFDILKTNEKDSNYLLHRLANSIVIIDEIQSYNPSIWDKMLFFIEKYSRYFNIKFILMSATLPKISDLKKGFKNVKFIDLLPDACRYISNANFSKRVVFNFELLNNTKEKIELEQLKEVLLDKSEKYAQKNASVKTIIEFIYKKTAANFLKLFEQDHFFDKIFILSGTILESRRREIINFIKKAKNESINILLITTQVVEAGVDIDMDLGFKNVSLLDSDEQLAGRVNRNAAKEKCEVYLFNKDDAKVLYGGDYRYEKTKKIPIDQQKEILISKDFKKLYDEVLSFIDETNLPSLKDSLPEYKKLLFKLNYPEIDKNFKIIDQNNLLVFVPLEIPIEIDDDKEGKERIFTEDEIEFLKILEVEAIEKEGEKYIKGEDVWRGYERLIEKQAVKKDKGFDIQQKIDFKKLQTILSKFCFSLVSNSKDSKEIQLFGEEKYGYFYFSYHDEIRSDGKIYDYKTGLNSEAFSDLNFC